MLAYWGKGETSFRSESLGSPRRARLASLGWTDFGGGVFFFIFFFFFFFLFFIFFFIFFSVNVREYLGWGLS